MSNGEQGEMIKLEGEALLTAQNIFLKQQLLEAKREVIVLRKKIIDLEEKSLQTEQETSGKDKNEKFEAMGLGPGDTLRVVQDQYFIRKAHTTEMKKETEQHLDD